MTKTTLLAVGGLAVGAALSASSSSAREMDRKTCDDSTEIVLASEVEWGALNPARGAQGPRAANLWGDRTDAGPSGFLVKFVDGFKSPPHIHNITYRGVVIRGDVHNDDPAAGPMWMPTASYWTPPAGEVHVTAARGKDNLIYVEIQQGPYLVQPSEHAADNGERPINVHASNVVWLDASATSWIDGGKRMKENPQLAFLWGHHQGSLARGTLIRLPIGFRGSMRFNGSTHRAVVIQGEPKVRTADHAAPKPLPPGSYFRSTNATLQVSSESDEPCILYVRSNGPFVVKTD